MNFTLSENAQKPHFLSGANFFCKKEVVNNMIKIHALKSYHINNFTVGNINNLLKQLSISARKLTASQMKKIVTTPGTTVLVAREERKSKIVGIAMIHIWEIPTKKKCFIDDVVVDKNYRGMKIGKRLTLALIEEAKNQNTECVDLSSQPKRKEANAMYEKLGFKKRETNYYRLRV